jgi:hypothetical protein
MRALGSTPARAAISFPISYELQKSIGFVTLWALEQNSFKIREYKHLVRSLGGSSSYVEQDDEMNTSGPDADNANVLE